MADPLEQLRQEREQVKQLFGKEPLTPLERSEGRHLGTIHPVHTSEKQHLGRFDQPKMGEFRVFSDLIEIHPEQGNSVHFRLCRVLHTVSSGNGVLIQLKDPDQEYRIVGDVWMLLQVAWSISKGKAPTYFWDQKIRELQASGHTTPTSIPPYQPTQAHLTNTPTQERGWMPYGLAATLVLLAASIALNIFLLTQDNSSSTPPEPRPAPTITSTSRSFPTTTSPPRDCHPSYPDVCIPSPPPDLDCQDITYRRFRVLHDVPNSDPHFFDLEFDGLGCESNR